MLKTTPARPGEFTDIPATVRRKVSRKRCKICGVRYGKTQFDRGRFEVWTPVQHIHHLLPRRFLEQHKIYEHSADNLYSVCNKCHGRAKAPEDRLFQGDLLGFLQGMKWAGFPVERIVAFAEKVGLSEFGRLQP